MTTVNDENTKDISKVYSGLEAHINTTDAKIKFIPQPASLPVSPSTSSPLNNTHNKECPCHVVLKQDDDMHCSLCEQPIPIIEELLSEKKLHEEEISTLQRQLTEEQLRIDQQLATIAQLNIKVDKVSGQLDIKTQEFNELQNDMELLNDKYVDEIERVAEIQHSKDMVESELEDLSRRLFEEANGMVANEKREKHHLELAQRHLENQLQETRERLTAEKMQLQELRARMQDMMVTSITPQQDEMPPKTPDHIKDITRLFSERISEQVDIDTLILDEFEEFVKQSTALPLKKIHSLAFMKSCQEEDIESCLRFGPTSRLSARKINEAIVLNTCFIEESPLGFAEEQAKRSSGEMPLKISAAKTLMWERFSTNNQGTVFSGCQACGRNDGTALPYRFRISYFDDWACIDRFCRDRLVAVCEFYVLIRNIRQGLYSSRSVPDLYHEAMRLRLQMFYARMGALPWTLRTIDKTSYDNGTSPFQVISSESSPLPKSSKQQEELPRRGSLNVTTEEAL
ncbi:hypothetical protein K501DRAFT_259643 [Backusella circina FSU 941]|nr:hypothetical protein K501DRAFT_259643 [Backusella circina FSU 941]